MVKDKICPKNNKEKKRTTAQIYATREEDETEESEPHEGSQCSLEGEVWMHMYRTKEFKEDFKEIEELDKDNQPTEESSDDEDIIENSESDSEDCENDNPIQ